MPHIHPLIDMTVDVFVVFCGRVLLRKHDKYKRWLAPGGHIELDEDPNEAAVREVREEVGLDVQLVGDRPSFPEGLNTILIPPRFLDRHRINETHEHVSHIYFATATTDEFSQGDDEVSEEIRWFTTEELDDPVWGISPEIRHYAHAALEACAR